MSLSLTSAELRQLGLAAQSLLTPLDHESIDAWRLAVNRQLKELLGADSAGFLLPVTDGLPLLSEEHDPAELARYPDYPPPPLVDGTPLWEAMAGARVATLATLYGERYELYTHSTYYQEYAGANGAHDTLAASVELTGVDARGMACMHFWHACPSRRLFGAREEAILRLLYPAFCSGAKSVMQWGHHQAGVVEALDALGHAVLVCDESGIPLHLTAALSAMLRADPEGDMIRSEMAGAAGTAAHARRRSLDGGIASAPVCRKVVTARAEYALRVSLFGDPSSGRTMTLVALERCSVVPRPDEDLQATFGLTRAELRVARLVARGRSNAEIADELSISPHTARRHTERIFLKLNIASRAEVAARILC